MKKLLLLFCSFLPALMFAQQTLDIRDLYLSELLQQSEYDEPSFVQSSDLEWRKDAIKKITSFEYNDPSFIKLTMALHMLKYKIGESTYNNAVAEYNYTRQKEDTEVSFLKFKEALETSSSMDLTEFFDDWIVGEGYPSYEINWYQNNANIIHIIASQEQSSRSKVSFYEMPIPIEVIGPDGESQFIRLELSENKQNFDGFIPFRIENVRIDPNSELISANNTIKKGIDQEELNGEISLYPNPAKSYIKVHNNGDAIVEKVSIFNMLGKLVLEEDNPLASIDLKRIGFGIHMVKIQTNLGTLHKTILKEQ